MEEKKKKSIKGIRIRTVNYGMIFISAILYVLLITATINASNKYKAMITSTDSYIDAQKLASQLADGSNYLTEQIQLYVMTMQPKYMEAYFTEANITRRRENALEELKQYHVSSDAFHLAGGGSDHGGDAFQFLETALSHSNELMEREIYAIKLIAVSQKEVPENLPEEVREMNLNAADQSLNAEEMVDKAREVIFSSSYQDTKALINGNISYFVSSVVDLTRQDQQNSFTMLKKTMSR